MNYVRYHADVEQVRPDEAETLAELSRLFREVQERVLRKGGEARRGTHAKGTGLLKGELAVADDLAPELAQGLFARATRYEALVRLSQGPSEDLSDKASGQRGLSIKLLGVEGPRVEGSLETTTQDWVLGVKDPAFTDGTVQAFLRTFRPAGAQTTRLPEGAIVAASRVARATEAALEAVGGGSAHLRFFGKKPARSLSDSYFSQAPLRHGDYIAQLSATPTPETLAAIGDLKSDTRDDDVFRHSNEAFFAAHDAGFDIRVQLCTDLAAMPVEDASVVWPEDQSPHRTVARLFLPRQDAWSDARRAYFEERLNFDPMHALEAHRPLGSIMRGRMAVYPDTQAFRQAMYGVAPAEPRSLADVPD